MTSSAIVVSSCANASVAHVTARCVSLARAPISGWVSENVSIGQPVSGHRQTRLRQATTTWLPNAGASCARWTRRPWPTATTPQARHPVTVSSVSTVTTRRPARSWRTSITCRPGALNISSARAHQGAPTPHLLSDTSGSPDERLLGRYRSWRPRHLAPRTATRRRRSRLTHAQIRHSYRGASSGRGRGGALQDVADQWVELAGEVALEAADDLHLGSAFGGAAGHVVAGGGVVAHAHDHDVVERGVGLPVPAPVESVPVGLARGRRDRTRAGQRGEVSL